MIKALALGAHGVFIGRAFLYGLGAGGEAGVTQCLDIIRKELDVTMAMCGLRDVRQVDEGSWPAGRLRRTGRSDETRLRPAAGRQAAGWSEDPYMRCMWRCIMR